MHKSFLRAHTCAHTPTPTPKHLSTLEQLHLGVLLTSLYLLLTMLLTIRLPQIKPFHPFLPQYDVQQSTTQIFRKAILITRYIMFELGCQWVNRFKSENNTMSQAIVLFLVCLCVCLSVSLSGGGHRWMVPLIKMSACLGLWVMNNITATWETEVLGSHL